MDHTKERRNVGRPRKTPEEKVENYPIATYMPDATAYELVREAADHEGLSISAWARAVLLREARHVLGRSE